MRNALLSFFGAMPGFALNLHTVGKADTVSIKMDSTPNLEDHGVHCMLVGYSLTPPNRCYRIQLKKAHGAYHT